MEDSKIIYYLIIGGIYLLSQVFKKKKPQDTSSEYDDQEAGKPTSTGPSFEELLKELQGESEKKSEQKEEVIDDRPKVEWVEPVVESPQRPAYDPAAVSRMDSKPQEVVSYDDLTEQKQRTNDRQKEVKGELKFERSENFKITEEENEVASSIHELLKTHDGARQAVVLKEVLDRKY